MTALGAMSVKAAGHPPAERREGARQRLMMRIAKLRCAGGEYPCVIHDVSETGARLRLLHGHPPDRHLYLELANGELFAIERRWIDGDFAGYRFSGMVDVDELILEPNPASRRPVRLRIAHPVTLTMAGQHQPARLVDLSAQGACIEADLKIPVTAPVVMAIDGALRRVGHVCWRKNLRHGVAFQAALTLAELAQLALQLQPFKTPLPQAGGERDLVRAIART